VVAAADAFGELAAQPPSARLDALTLGADARRRANLGEHEALYQALTRQLVGEDPKLVLLFAAARPGRLFEPDMLVLADHLRALLFPTTLRYFSASRPVPLGLESGLDPTWYVADLTGGAPFAWDALFEPVATGEGWRLLRYRGQP
jgi:hypothetical protein